MKKIIKNTNNNRSWKYIIVELLWFTDLTVFQAALKCNHQGRCVKRHFITFAFLYLLHKERIKLFVSSVIRGERSQSTQEWLKKEEEVLV